MRLSPARFNRFLGSLAQSVEWRRASDCPCRDPHSGAPAVDCAHLALSGQKVQRAWAQHGLFQKGDVVCTLPSNEAVFAIGEFDRVVFRDSSVPFSVVRTNDGQQNIGFPVLSIDRVFWLNDDKSAIVEGRVPRISDTGTLTWPSGGPPSGRQYTLDGRKHPEYFCYMEFAQDRAHHGGEPLPRRVVLRLFDLYSRGS
jgi:hypothetical protein